MLTKHFGGNIMKLTKQFEKIARLAGKDPAKLLEEYNLTATVRTGKIQNHFKVTEKINLEDYKNSYIYINADGKTMTVPESVTVKINGVDVIRYFKPNYVAKTTKVETAPTAPPAPPEKTAPKNRHQRRAEKAQGNS